MAQWYPLGGNGGIPSTMASTANEKFWRVKTQTLDIGRQYIVDGIGFTSNWIELDIVKNASRYAAFTVPAGFYMALDFRLLNPSSDKQWYHVYPEGTFTLGAAKPNDATGFAKTINLRQNSAFIQSPLTRYNLSSAPTRITDSIIDDPMWGESSTGSGNKSSGSLGPDNTFLLLDPDQTFLLQVLNLGSGDANIQIYLNYAFIPEQEVPPMTT